MMNQHTSATPEKPLAVVASNLGSDNYELARDFAQKGYDIIVAATNPSIVEEAEEFKELGVNAVSYQLDLTTTEGVEQLYSRIIATGRPVEVMVIHSDLNTDTELAKKVLTDMANNGHGHILFTGSGEIDPDLQEEAKLKGVTLTVLKTDVKYEEPRLLH